MVRSGRALLTRHLIRLLKDALLLLLHNFLQAARLPDGRSFAPRHLIRSTAVRPGQGWYTATALSAGLHWDGTQAAVLKGLLQTDVQ